MFKKYFSVLKFSSKRLLSSQNMGLNWTKQEKILMEPFEYIQKVPCKHYRFIAPAFNHWLQIPEDKLNSIQAVNQLWVTWNILLDDIQDNSPFRYGVPAAHKVYGVGVTINAANNLLILVQQQIMEIGHLLGLEIFTKRLKEYLLGQGMDLHWRDKYICPTNDAHIEMTRKKCGSFSAFPVELMQVFSSNKTDYTSLAADMGVYYQILDDYYNLFHPKALPRLASIEQENHITCSDITECKVSLSVIHASQFPDVASELAYILKLRTSDPKLQNRVISLLKKHGSDEYTRHTLKTLEADIRNEIDQLGGNPTLTEFMDDLSFQTHELEQQKDMYT